MQHVAVIGAGPAGLAAAEILAGAGIWVSVYDRMPSPGRKFLLAGRGGLNLTHTEPLPRFLARYGPAAPALTPAITAFPPAALMAWCRSLGQEVFTGSSGRVFPMAFKATPLLRAWLRRLAAQGVQLHTGQHWLGWTADGALRFADGTVQADATILALGGASWPRLGADGGWVPALRAAGVPVTPLRPANCGFLHAWPDYFAARHAGQPLHRVRATHDGHTAMGEAMLTATGIEGGVIYALSAALRTTIERTGHATLTLDLRPDLDGAAFAQRLGGPGLSAANALRRAGLNPTASALVRVLGAAPTTAKALPLVLTGTAPIDRAISTAGGVALSAIDPDCMLHQRPGVFVAGEMLDWEAPTGGYLLQAAFSTGRAAAYGALQWLSIAK